MQKFQQFFFRFFKKRQISKSQSREPLFLDMLAYGLGDDFITMIDVGSNDGLETIYALNLKSHKIKVHLLEPDPGNLEKCIENIHFACKNSKNVQFHELAISNKTVEKAYFFRNPKAPHLNSATRSDDATESMSIAYTTLDDFFTSQAIESPLLIKMDIEGHEVEVLEGLLKYASTRKKIKILMEIHPHTYSTAHSLENILQKYFDLGFKVSHIESAGLPIPDKFHQEGMQPIKISGKRGLYLNPTNDFVLMAACKEQLNKINDSGKVTKKIVRSLLLTND